MPQRNSWLRGGSGSEEGRSQSPGEPRKQAGGIPSIDVAKLGVGKTERLEIAQISLSHYPAGRTGSPFRADFLGVTSFSRDENTAASAELAVS